MHNGKFDMKHQTLLKLLLTSTLLTACGDSQTDAERKARLGITSDGEAGEIPTINGNQAGEGDAIKLNIAGTDLRFPNNFLGKFLSEPEQRTTLSSMLTHHQKYIDGMKAFAAKYTGDPIFVTSENTEEYKAIERDALYERLELQKLETGILKQVKEAYSAFDVKGDLTRVADATSPWKTLIDTGFNVNLFRWPTQFLTPLLRFSTEEDSLLKEISHRTPSRMTIAAAAAVNKETKNLQEELGAARRAAEVAYNRVRYESSENTEDLDLLATALEAAIATRAHNLLFEPVANVSELDYYTAPPTLHAKGAQLINTISDAMHKKGFVRKDLLHDDASPMEITVTPSSQSHTDRLAASFMGQLRDLAYNAVYLNSYPTPGKLQDNDIFSDKINELFVVSNEVYNQSSDKTLYHIYTIYLGDSQSEFYTYPAELHPNVSAEAYKLSPIRPDRPNPRITEAEYNKIILDMNKAFLSALIPMPEFKGLFDFLKEVEGFKDDAEFMALFAPSALALSSGALHTLSSGLTFAARQHAQGIDATNLTLNGTSGSNLQLNLPVYLNLAGALSAAKTTENLSATASYYVTPNTSVGIQHTYANAGEGFAATSYQTESNAIISHTFNSVFVEGGFGYVAANQVHAHQVNGTQTYAKVGIDAANGFFSPFVQLTYRNLNQDAEFNLEHTGYAIGLDSTLANITTYAYTLTGGISLKTTYVHHNWHNLSGAAIGNTQFVETALSGNVNLNLNNGISLISHASFTPTSTSVGFNVGLNY